MLPTEFNVMHLKKCVSVSSCVAISMTRAVTRSVQNCEHAMIDTNSQYLHVCTTHWMLVVWNDGKLTDPQSNISTTCIIQYLSECLMRDDVAAVFESHDTGHESPMQARFECLVTSLPGRLWAPMYRGTCRLCSLLFMSGVQSTTEDPKRENKTPAGSIWCARSVQGWLRCAVSGLWHNCVGLTCPPKKKKRLNIAIGDHWCKLCDLWLCTWSHQLSLARYNDVMAVI